MCGACWGTLHCMQYDWKAGCTRKYKINVVWANIRKEVNDQIRYFLAVYIVINLEM
jgi:hypothetical protein